LYTTARASEFLSRVRLHESAIALESDVESNPLYRPTVLLHRPIGYRKNLQVNTR